MIIQDYKKLCDLELEQFFVIFTNPAPPLQAHLGEDVA